MDLLRRAEAGFIVAPPLDPLDILAIHGLIHENQKISTVNMSCEDSGDVSIAPF